MAKKSPDTKKLPSRHQTAVIQIRNEVQTQDNKAAKAG